ncbi:putative peptide chain release factor eRF1/aRF1, eRF1 domain 2, eRF1, domain 2 superfamily [Helianthus annuus]|nr:putative peptide chain release factor eRF1/aRF1, eRF1 domain 2, eRF1, domain 2 superfamily [Helianthus annuus]KAJ0807895.1 putative peptide chain release factor eRF1/aRF1, eRF1 domain 2, eRF1, domain 2 superfamily [Helianthus annuus]KAJ0807897.1 putative peptide chain release factor eRF1/aRF1, eRF1 domain 2, eRF1, domain 2 superfamily [Helianthus annuus]KAJ0937710.1 putative peptide chain release factor eRF1/aRF1, eRF1 domain 2, eRF1, domain 2 superfamily [Helianthus annuus]KAJ0945668.1 puta
MDGSGTLFGTLSGNSREVLHKFDVDLPKKHGRGGQSALRFGRLRMEKRHNYLRKTAELAKQLYINPVTNQPNVSGLILAGKLNKARPSPCDSHAWAWSSLTNMNMNKTLFVFVC